MRVRCANARGRFTMPRIGAVILAAGASERFGAPKQLLELDGRPLVARAADAVLGAGASDVVVVVGAHAGRVRAALAGGAARIVENAGWREGMGSSIRAGVGAVAGADAVLIALCDQPFFTARAASRLVAEWKRRGGIVAARYGGHAGAPAVFGKDYLGELSLLRGDEGARKILAVNAGRVATVDLPELAIDIDTPKDWRALPGCCI